MRNEGSDSKRGLRSQSREILHNLVNPVNPVEPGTEFPLTRYFSVRSTCSNARTV